MNNYDHEARWDAEHDIRLVGEQAEENADETSDIEFGMSIMYPEIDREVPSINDLLHSV